MYTANDDCFVKKFFVFFDGHIGSFVVYQVLLQILLKKAMLISYLDENKILVHVFEVCSRYVGKVFVFQIK